MTETTSDKVAPVHEPNNAPMIQPSTAPGMAAKRKTSPQTQMISDRDQLRKRVDVDRRVHDERENTRRDFRDRHEARLRIVGHRPIRARIHHESIDGHEKRQTIGSSARRRLRTDIAARTRLVLDDDGLVPALPQFLAEDAREEIGPRAGRERNVEPDCLLRLPQSHAWHHGGKG